MTEGPRPPRPSDLNAGYAILGTLLAGMGVWGGVGWLLDRWLHITVLLPIGVIVGMAAAIYIVWIKYAK